MSLISVNNLTFRHDGAVETIFENTSFQIDTDWKLGFIGRNGRGKTTFLNLLMGRFPYSGSITASVGFDYFPFAVEDLTRPALQTVRDFIAPFTQWEQEMERLLEDGSTDALMEYAHLQEQYQSNDGYIIDELIKKESFKLSVGEDALARPFGTLSNGERTKLMLAALFLKKNRFLLIDEPTNHLDLEGREQVAHYLAAKQGFIIVSHDRLFLDEVVDHILSLNRSSIEVQRGNFSSWQQNKEQQDQYELAQNARLKKDIRRLEDAYRQKASWSDKLERSKIGNHTADRGFVGAQAARMMKRAKHIEQRKLGAIEEKSSLLKNVETEESLKIHLLPYVKQRLVELNDLSIQYAEEPLFTGFDLVVEQGERIALEGRNGSGKSSILKLLAGGTIPHSGRVNLGSGLILSCVAQDTSFLAGNLRDFAQEQEVDESLLLAILRKLDFSRAQFDIDMSRYSQGQRKKVLIATSLAQPAHLYLWDEPLNYIDLLSRIQIERLLLEYCPTMVFVEHDALFVQRIATRRVRLGR